MHKPIRLPPSDHYRIPPRYLHHQLPPPRLSWCQLQLQHPPRHPLPKHSQRVQIALLLPPAEEEHRRGGIEGLEGANAEKGRGHAREYACGLHAFAGDGEVGQGDKREGAGGRDLEGVHCCGEATSERVGVLKKNVCAHLLSRDIRGWKNERLQGRLRCARRACGLSLSAVIRRSGRGRMGGELPLRILDEFDSSKSACVRLTDGDGSPIAKLASP